MSTPRGARIHYGVYGLGRLRDPAMCTGWAWAVTLRDKAKLAHAGPAWPFWLKAARVKAAVEETGVSSLPTRPIPTF